MKKVFDAGAVLQSCKKLTWIKCSFLEIFVKETR